jgi:hypothetical protein
MLGRPGYQGIYLTDRGRTEYQLPPLHLAALLDCCSGADPGNLKNSR